MTFLLKNPAKVRDYIEQGVELLVKFEGKVVMKIVVPTEIEKPKIPPALKIGKTNFKFDREEIYDQKS